MSGKGLPEKVDEQRRAVVERVLADMSEKGVRWAENGWARVMSPRNAATGAAYKGGNRVHLAAVAAIRGYGDQRWMTFNQAREAGWRVRKGAKSCVVEKWKLFRFPAEGGEADGADEGGPFRAVPRCVGWWNVFNAEEVEGVPPEAPLRDAGPDAAGALADRFIASSRCPVSEEASDRAFYSPAADSVTVPLRAQFAEDEGFLRVLLHEMSHSTMVPLGRVPGGPFGSPGYAKEELVAELGSMFAAADAGFDCAAMASADPGEGYYGAHVGYLKSWMSALRDDPGELFRAASRASAAADYLVGRLGGDAGAA